MIPRALAGAAARATALAVAALALSHVESGARLPFFAVWGGLFLLGMVPLSLIELPLVTALPKRAGGAVAAVGWGIALARVLPVNQALGWIGVLAMVTGGGAIGYLLPPPGEWKPKRAIPCLVVLMGIVVVAPSRPKSAVEEERPPIALDDLALARAIATTFMTRHPPARLAWSWEETVAVEGLLAYARKSGDPAPLAYARAWADAHAAQALAEPLWADAAAPAMTLLDLPRGADDGKVLARVDDYIRTRAPRTRAGVPSHPGLLLGGLLPRQAWVDSLFMHGMYLDRRGEWGLEEARRLGLAMAAELQDPGTGLFRHAAVDVGPLTVRLPVERTFWARGNGWAACFLVDREIARPDAEIRAARERLFAAILAAQDAETGLWRTDLLGGPGAENPFETSASALFACALRRMTPDSEAARRAIAALRTRIRLEPDGGATVLGTSTGTHPGFRAYYRSVPLADDVPHGVGSVLMALSAGSR